MWAYIVRRILLTIPIVLGVVLITMLLFSFVAADPARAWAGKVASDAQLEAIRAKMGLDKPRWFKWNVAVRKVDVAWPSTQPTTAPALPGVLVTVSTPWKHGLSAGDKVVVEGMGGAYAGTHTVEEVKGEKQFAYRIATAPPQPPNVSAARIHSAALSQRLKQGFDSQLFDILTFRIYSLKSMRYDENIWDIIKTKAPASMAIQIPAFVIVLGIQLTLGLFAAARRGRWPDLTITVVAVLIMSVPALSVYLFAQWSLGMEAGVFPVAGWESDGLAWVRFAALPILVSVMLGIGGGTRLYRTVMLDEINSDYVRTARAKGVSNREVLFTHVLKNGLIPVITNTVTALPGLILGALLLERIFQIPGLGSFIVEALNNYDRTVVMGMTFALSILYCVLILISDILYSIVNPQVSLR